MFRLPSGSVGKAFLDEMTRLVDLYTNKTGFESTALLALTVFGPLILQKPSKNSKNKEHIIYMKKRLEQWKRGDFNSLIREGNAIQKKLIQNKRKPQSNQKVFTRLMLQGKVSAALKWISNTNNGLLDITPEIINTLQMKHPEAAIPLRSSLIVGPINKVEDVIYDNIDGQSIYNAAKATKGSAGPSGLDSDLWRRILCSKSFSSSSVNLCESLAKLCRRLCRENVDPKSISTLVACRLIPLDKNPGIRPIGIGEVLRRILGKAVTSFIKQDIFNYLPDKKGEQKLPYMQ